MRMSPGLLDHDKAPTGPVRVLHVVPSLYGGGMERATVRLVRAWTRLSNSSTVAANITHGVCILRDADRHLLAQCQECAGTWILGRKSNYARDFWAFRRLRKIIREYQPDIVHARGTSAWFDATLATMARPGVRLLLSYHGRTDLRPPTPWRRRMLRWTASRADAVVAVCRDAASMMHRQWSVDAAKLWVIPNGVDVKRFMPLENPIEKRRIRDELGLNDLHHVVICVANHHPIKGLDTLLRAWRQISMVDRAARLLLAGEGPLRQSLHQLANDLRCVPTVRLLGARDDVDRLLQCADVAVLPSRSEGCSNAIQEAMASGLPVVATDVGGNSELIEPNRTGWLVPVDAADRLAETVSRVLFEPAARRRVGQAARLKAVQQFSLDNWIRRYALLYRDVLHQTSPLPTGILEELACVG